MKIGKTIDSILDALFGKTVKGRWKKVLIFIISIIFVTALSIIFSTNIGYTKKDGFYWKPWNVNIEVKK